jgi:hypothetical protein
MHRALKRQSLVELDIVFQPLYTTVRNEYVELIGCLEYQLLS